jgi:hypothetical protein
VARIRSLTPGTGERVAQQRCELHTSRRNDEAGGIPPASLDWYASRCSAARSSPTVALAREPDLDGASAADSLNGAGRGAECLV